MYAVDIKHPHPSLEDKFRTLYALSRNKKIDLSFRPPYLDLLKAFGNPHLHLPPVIHVAGTNGKGSIIAILRAVLEASGYNVHTYTSPHLMAFNERIRLAGEIINNKYLEELIDEALILNKNRDITFFEITTAMAFAAFSRSPADICLLETGLGGRLDCTNIIENPLLTVINTIGYDHMEHLGETLPLIAAEKAGIMKRGAPCIIGVQSSEAQAQNVLPVFEEQAYKMNVPLHCAGTQWSITPCRNGVRFTYGPEIIDLPRPALEGVHQINNAGAALAALFTLKNRFNIDETTLRTGLQKVTWAGRLQNLTADFSTLLPAGWSLWLDGGHNADAARALAEQAKHWAAQDSDDLHLILGMMGSKDPQSFLTPLLPHLKSLTLTTIDSEHRAVQWSNLKEDLSNGQPLTVEETADFQSAIRHIIQNAEAPGRILITGSLYLAGDVLKQRPIRAHNGV